MRNPLSKRFPRELKSELGKYIVLFIFIAGMIGIVSGFMVAGNSMLATYNNSFEKYNIEDGNFELVYKAKEALISTLEAEGLTIYENFYVEEETKDIDTTLRIFRIRQEVNLACLMEGSLPVKNNEIAIDRMYADNNDLAVGDTLVVGGREMLISGLVSLSDYTALFSSTSEMVFDALKFGVAVVTENGFEEFGDVHLHYSYSWIYDNPPADDIEAKELSEDFLEVLSGEALLANYIPAYINQAIVFAGNDIGRDSAMIGMFLYIVVLIIAFVFAITISNTIAKEASVIGTLRATGYSKAALVRHYLVMPMLVTLTAAVAGNILGYTWGKDFAESMYYNSYSLPTYVTLWNADAFIKTTVIPLVIMFVINLAILICKLNISPLKLIRRDLGRRKKKKAFKLNTKIGIMKRFRLRIIFQNMPNYITIVIGIFLANIIMLFGCVFEPLLDKYQEDITSNLLCEYQYVLKAQVETETEGVEKYAVTTLETLGDVTKSEQVMIYGIYENSNYVDMELSGSTVIISNAYAEKYDIEEGDEITLKEQYGVKEYSFIVTGVNYYPAGIAVFMDAAAFNEVFEFEEGYYNGYFSDEEIKDVDERLIASKITIDDMTKTSRQLKHSMGEMMSIFLVFGVLMFMLIIYLLSKIIIEKNANSISMAKILGYSDAEINSLYVVSTAIVVIVSLLVTLPLVNIIMEEVFAIMFMEYAGWLPYYVPFSVLVKIVVLGIAGYAIIAFIQMRNVKRIPLDEALKNVE